MLRKYLLLVATFIKSWLRPTPPKPDSPLSKGENPELEVVIHQSERLTGRNGRAPEQVVARALAGAFEAAERTYRIRFDVPPVQFRQAEAPGAETLAEFRNRFGDDGRDVDCRLCLIDAPGGGRAELAGVYGVMGANNIDERFDPSLARTPLSPRARNVRGAIHEVGHTLGGRHSTPILADAPAMRYSRPMVEQLAHYIETGEPAPEPE